MSSHPTQQPAQPSVGRWRVLAAATVVALVAAPAYAGPVVVPEGTAAVRAMAEPGPAPAPEPQPGPDPSPEPSPAPTDLALTLPQSSRADLVRPVTATLTAQDGSPVPDREVLVERGDGDTWTPVVRLVTGADGTAAGEVTVPRAPASQTWRARLLDVATDTDPAEPLVSAAQQLGLVPWPTTVRRAGPRRVVDGRAITQTWTVRTGRGAPVAGATLVVRSRSLGRTEREVRTTDAAGQVTLRDRPRDDSRWVARVRSGTWHEAARSTVVVVDNLPAGPVVVLPDEAPRPTVSVPPQPRALRAGPRPRVMRIPGPVWREMTGVTWRRGCPVGRADLRLIRVSYWDYDGYARRGEIVVNAATAYTVAATFADIYRSRLPIRSMYRVDRFGYSSRVRGGDDFASMAAGNTSGFNCRNVVNYSARSPHAYGFAIDINTWENPYRSRTGIVPNTYWQYHSHPLVAWRSTSHPMIRTLYSHGWSWPYGLGDTQHFSAPARGRYAPAARSAEEAEHLLEHGADPTSSDAAGHAEHTGYVPGSHVGLD